MKLRKHASHVSEASTDIRRRTPRSEAKGRDQRPASWIAAEKRLGIGARVLTDSHEGKSVSFLLAARHGVLYMECGHIDDKSQSVFAMCFASDEAFRRWCEADRLQFTYPLLFANLRRSGSELFGTP